MRLIRETSIFEEYFITQSKSKISSQLENYICLFRMRTDHLVKITQEETERLKKEEVLGELNIGIIEIVTGNPHTPPSTIIG